MYVRARLLRNAGRLIRDHDINNAQVVEGILTGNSRCYELHKPLFDHLSPLARLFDARLIRIDRFKMHLRGIEEANGQAVLQEWSCEILNWYGCDNLGTPLSGPSPLP